MVEHVPAPGVSQFGVQRSITGKGKQCLCVHGKVYSEVARSRPERPAQALRTRTARQLERFGRFSTFLRGLAFPHNLTRFAYP